MPSLHAPPNRWIAFSLHALLSLLIIGSIAAAVVALWFPAGLYRVAKLGKLFETILLVDVTVGPLLTLLVYKPGKRGLKLDLAAIALLQLAFLGYGTFVLWGSRPLYLVGSREAFVLVFANDLPAGAAEKADTKGWRRFRGTGPRLAGLEVDDKLTRYAVMDAFLFGPSGALLDPTRYVPYPRVAKEIAAAATKPPRKQADAQAASRPPSLPLISARNTAVMLVDPRSGQPLRAAP